MIKIQLTREKGTSTGLRHTAASGRPGRAPSARGRTWWGRRGGSRNVASAGTDTPCQGARQLPPSTAGRLGSTAPPDADDRRGGCRGRAWAGEGGSLEVWGSRPPAGVSPKGDRPSRSEGHRLRRR